MACGRSRRALGVRAAHGVRGPRQILRSQRLCRHLFPHSPGWAGGRVACKATGSKMIRPRGTQSSNVRPPPSSWGVDRAWGIRVFFGEPHETASLVTQTVKNPSAMQETWVQSLGWEDPLATHSSILARRIPMAGYSPWGRKASDKTERLSRAQKPNSSRSVPLKYDS